jgi:hypothetical protein
LSLSPKSPRNRTVLGKESAPISKLTTANYYAWRLIRPLSPAISSWAYRDDAWISPDLGVELSSWGQEA